MTAIIMGKMGGTNKAALLLVCSLSPLRSQTPSPPAVFEAASIKPSKAGYQSVINRMPGGRFTAQSATLKILVKWAYELTDDDLAGGPNWTDSDRYDIVATPERDAGNEQVFRDEQIRAMLRALLAERFKLAMHRETKEIPAYELSVAKGGPKLNATTHAPGPHVLMEGNGRTRVMTFQAAPTSYIARCLSAQLRKKVVDGTNLPGAFDCKLEWSSTDTDAPSIFTALNEQLGLRLRMEKAAIEIYAIDHVERPSDN